MMQTSFEERRTFCNRELDRVKEFAKNNNLWYILICRTSPLSEKLDSHVSYFEKRADYEDALEHERVKYEHLRNKLSIAYWIETNDDFTSGGLFDED